MYRSDGSVKKLAKDVLNLGFGPHFLVGLLMLAAILWTLKLVGVL